MTISINPNGLRTILDQANPSTLDRAFAALGLGMLVRTMKTYLRNKNPNTAPANPYTTVVAGTSLQSIQLPDDAKAHTILRAYARTGTGTKGELTVSAAGTTPTATHVSISPSGDLWFLASDAYTNVDVVYEPEKVDVVELTLPVAAGVLTIPSKYTAQGVVILMEAEILAGTHTGKVGILSPNTAPATTLFANLNVAKTQVLFDNADDAPTQARVKLGVASAIDVDALLTGASPVL